MKKKKRIQKLIEDEILFDDRYYVKNSSDRKCKRTTKHSSYTDMRSAMKKIKRIEDYDFHASEQIKLMNKN